MDGQTMFAQYMVFTIVQIEALLSSNHTIRGWAEEDANIQLVQ
jgi:hypothetical protein